MNRTLIRTLPLLLVVWCLTFVPTSRGAILVFQAVLSGPAEEPPNASPGTGFSFVTIDTTAFTLQLDVTFSGLLGTTSASHIHAATAVPGTGTAGVATTTPTFAGFPLGVTSGTYSTPLDLTQASSYNPAYVTANGGTTTSAGNALITAIQGGRAYLNIHTSVIPAGEIRGFFTPVAVPEPSSLNLLGLGLAAGVLAHRRRGRA